MLTLQTMKCVFIGSATMKMLLEGSKSAHKIISTITGEDESSQTFAAQNSEEIIIEEIEEVINEKIIDSGYNLTATVYLDSLNELSILITEEDSLVTEEVEDFGIDINIIDTRQTTDFQIYTQLVLQGFLEFFEHTTGVDRFTSGAFADFTTSILVFAEESLPVENGDTDNE